ncbi:unnamed protein product (macronuclear) [Paramecium tetraurelia]|uniref:Uncharacterized protein n=1 Tax=Paramecium tetraurelia TaxID=5888 RepID=A0DMH5_PARTE|nr:uncharacterized protein GSPATT00018460001 [Paramecium tetraurelia]CAK84242.1 unnamed protein product [Paramecium tetraurelia]|eukprot:XP_001451639.1 hypothetical protein (macronuclear) [Paramecium tetraurelia strain d4-2]
MHKQLPNYILTPSTHYITKTPEKAINTSPFRGSSFSDKQSMTPNKQNIGYHYVQQQTINQNTKHQIPYYENASPLVHESKQHLMQRVQNLEENLREIVKKYDQSKEDLERERTIKYDSNRNYSQLYQRYQDQEREVLKYQQVAKSIETMQKQVQRELQEQKEKWNAKNNEIQEQKKVQEKLQSILKQKEREINDFKLKLKEEREFRSYENQRLVQEFTQTYQDLTLQNDQLIQENNELRTLILEIDNQPQPYSSANQSQQNIQADSDYLEDPQLRQIVQQYLTKNEESYLDQISDKQLRAAVSIIKEIFQTVTSQQLKEIKSQQFQQPKQISEEIEINLLEARKNREFLIKEIKNKMDKIVKSKEFDLIEFNEIQKEIEELKKQLSSVENIIQEMEQQLILNPHRNSCVSFDDHEFQ